MRLKLKRKIDKKDSKDFTPDITFHAELKAESGDNDELIIQGMASTNDLDRVDDIVDPDSFKKTIKDFLKNPVLLLNHGQSAEGRVPVGKVLEAEVRPKGLFVKAMISKTEEKLREKIKEGLFRAFSFGFRILNSDNIQRAGKTIRKITDLELFEVSIVSIPANRRALFSVVKGFESGTDLIYENDFVEGIKGDLDLAHKRICDVEDWVNRVKEHGLEEVKVLKNDNIGKCTCADGPNGSSTGYCLMCDKKLIKDIAYDEKDKGIDEDNLQNPTDEIKSLMKEVEELKAGRILSAHNRKALDNALKTMESASVALKAVLDIQEAGSRREDEEEEEEGQTSFHVDDQLSEEEQLEEKQLEECLHKVAEAAIEGARIIVN